MPIYEGSRYEATPMHATRGPGGVEHMTLQLELGVPEVVDYTVHRVVGDERMEQLAEDAYGDADLWWVIADANPQLGYPDQLKPGALVRIPLTEVEEEL